MKIAKGSPSDKSRLILCKSPTFLSIRVWQWLQTEARVRAKAIHSSKRRITATEMTGWCYTSREVWSHIQAFEQLVLISQQAIKLLDSSTSYEYDPRSQTYVQHDFARELLTRLLEVERKKLQQIPISSRASEMHAWLTIKQDHTVASLIESALADRSLAMDYLSLAITAISEQTKSVNYI